MSVIGRPTIGKYVSLPLGDIKDEVEKYAKAHGITTNESVRELVRLGLNAVLEEDPNSRTDAAFVESDVDGVA